MALYNFQPRFVSPIESGAKTHTIRADRKRQTRIGEMLHLYTGLRHKGARKILTTICTKVEQIEIRCVGGSEFPQVFVDGVSLAVDERQALAKRDGFANWGDMREFWKGRLPFKGQIIHWRFPGVR